MKNIDYDIPIFESNDVANLNLYSEKMAEAIKGQIDKFGNPLAFKEIKQNISELDLISNPQSGDIYGVIETNKNYIWNGKEWIIYSDIMELDNYYNKEEINQKIENIQALPTGGTKGQVLTKQSETNGDANWEDIEANEVFVGAEEPTTGEKVWFRKGKNYLDISKLKSRTTYGITFEPTATGIKITGTAQDVYAYGGSVSVELKKGKTYMLYGNNAGNTFKLELRKGSTIITTIKTSGDKVTFTPSDNINIVTFVLEGISKGTTYNYEINNLQIEQGSKNTSYEAYIEQKIFVRNSNGAYEEFAKKSEEVYSTEEQRIGTWIDGKPLYRKIVNAQFGTVVQGTETTVEVNLKNVDFILVDKYWLDRKTASSVINQGYVTDALYLGYTSFSNSNTTLRFRTKQSWVSNTAIYAIIEYTKTTD